MRARNAKSSSPSATEEDVLGDVNLRGAREASTNKETSHASDGRNNRDEDVVDLGEATWMWTTRKIQTTK